MLDLQMILFHLLVDLGPVQDHHQPDAVEAVAGSAPGVQGLESAGQGRGVERGGGRGRGMDDMADTN